MHLSLATLHKILFLQGARLFYQNYILQSQQVFNQLLLLLRGELTDVHAVRTISDYMVYVSTSVTSSWR